MGTLADYFNKSAYGHTYSIGDRVYGKWRNIPFVGSVGNDRLINYTDGPEITIHLDLPIRINNCNNYVIIVKHKDVKLLKIIE